MSCLAAGSELALPAGQIVHSGLGSGARQPYCQRLPVQSRAAQPEASSGTPTANDAPQPWAARSAHGSLHAAADAVAPGGFLRDAEAGQAHLPQVQAQRSSASRPAAPPESGAHIDGAYAVQPRLEAAPACSAAQGGHASLPAPSGSAAPPPHEVLLHTELLVHILGYVFGGTQGAVWNELWARYISTDDSRHERPLRALFPAKRSLTLVRQLVHLASVCKQWRDIVHTRIIKHCALHPVQPASESIADGAALDMRFAHLPTGIETVLANALRPHDMLAFSRLTSLTCISLDACCFKLTARTLARIELAAPQCGAAIPALQQLSVADCAGSASAVACASTLSSLKAAAPAGSTSAGASAVSALRALRWLHCLRSLSLTRCYSNVGGLAEEDMLEIGALTTLTHLRLAHTSFVPQAYHYVAQLRGLRDLDLSWTTTTAGPVLPNELAQLSTLQQLERLDLASEAMQYVSDMMPLARGCQLSALRLRQTATYDRLARTALELFQRLRALDLAHCGWRDEHLECLTGLQHLRVLVLKRNLITAAGVEMLTACAGLTYLDVSYCELLDYTAAAALQGSFPLLQWPLVPFPATGQHDTADTGAFWLGLEIKHADVKHTRGTCLNAAPDAPTASRHSSLCAGPVDRLRWVAELSEHQAKVEEKRRQRQVAADAAATVRAATATPATADRARVVWEQQQAAKRQRFDTQALQVDARLGVRPSPPAFPPDNKRKRSPPSASAALELHAAEPPHKQALLSPPPAAAHAQPRALPQSAPLQRVAERVQQHATAPLAGPAPAAAPAHASGSAAHGGHGTPAEAALAAQAAPAADRAHAVADAAAAVAAGTAEAASGDVDRQFVPHTAAQSAGLPAHAGFLNAHANQYQDGMDQLGKQQSAAAMHAHAAHCASHQAGAQDANERMAAPPARPQQHGAAAPTPAVPSPSKHMPKLDSPLRADDPEAAFGSDSYRILQAMSSASPPSPAGGHA